MEWSDKKINRIAGNYVNGMTNIILACITEPDLDGVTDEGERKKIERQHQDRIKKLVNASLMDFRKVVKAIIKPDIEIAKELPPQVKK